MSGTTLEDMIRVYLDEDKEVKELKPVGFEPTVRPKPFKFADQRGSGKNTMLPAYLEAIQLLRERKEREASELARIMDMKDLREIAHEGGIDNLPEADFEKILDELNRTELDRKMGVGQWTNYVLGQSVTSEKPPPRLPNANYDMFPLVGSADLAHLRETGRLRHEPHMPRPRLLTGALGKMDLDPDPKVGFDYAKAELRTAARFLMEETIYLYCNGIRVREGDKFTGRGGDTVVGIDSASGAKFIGEVRELDDGKIVIQQVDPYGVGGEFHAFYDHFSEKLCAAFKIPRSYLFPHEEKEGEEMNTEYEDEEEDEEEEDEEEYEEDVRVRNLATFRLLQLVVGRLRNPHFRPEDWEVKALAFVSRYTFIPFGPPWTTGGAYFRSAPDLGEKAADVTEEFLSHHWYSEWQRPIKLSIASIVRSVANRFFYSEDAYKCDMIEPEVYERYIIPGVLANLDHVTTDMSPDEVTYVSEGPKGLMLDERDPFEPDFKVDWDKSKEDRLLPCAVDTCPYARPAFAGKVECPLEKTTRAPGQFCRRGFERNISLQVLDEAGLGEAVRLRNDGIMALVTCPQCKSDQYVKIRKTVMTTVVTMYNVNVRDKKLDIGNRCCRGDDGVTTSNGYHNEFCCFSCGHSWPIPEWLKGKDFDRFRH